MEAIPKSDIKSVIKSDIRFDISIKRTTWIGHECHTSNFNPKSILVESTIHFIIVAEEFKCFTWTGRME